MLVISPVHVPKSHLVNTTPDFIALFKVVIPYVIPDCGRNTIFTHISLFFFF